MIATLERDRVVLDDLEVGELANYYDDAEPEDVLIWAFDRFGEPLSRHWIDSLARKLRT